VYSCQLNGWTTNIAIPSPTRERIPPSGELRTYLAIRTVAASLAALGFAAWAIIEARPQAWTLVVAAVAFAASSAIQRLRATSGGMASIVADGIIVFGALYIVRPFP
jgi:hypothetical protein